MSGGITCYVVNDTSPERYNIKGLNEDEIKETREEIEPVKYFSSVKTPQLKLLIYFKQPYKKNQIDIQELALSKCTHNKYDEEKTKYLSKPHFVRELKFGDNEEDLFVKTDTEISTVEVHIEEKYNPQLAAIAKVKKIKVDFLLDKE